MIHSCHAHFLVPSIILQKNYWNATAEMIHCIHPKPWKDMLCGFTLGRLIQNRLVGWNQNRLAL
jgi:hypothetical protein